MPRSRMSMATVRCPVFANAVAETVAVSFVHGPWTRERLPCFGRSDVGGQDGGGCETGCAFAAMRARSNWGQIPIVLSSRT